MRTWLLVFIVAGCAGHRAPLPSVGFELPARVYAYDEAKTQALVRELLARENVVLAPTGDPHVLVSVPKAQATLGASFAPITKATLTTSVRDLGKFDLRPDGQLYLETQTWKVVFEALGPEQTSVRVLRGSQLTWANAAERSEAMQVAVEAPRTETNQPLTFVRDSRVEALVASQLEAQVSVEVSEASGANARTVDALADPVVEVLPRPSACALSDADVGPYLAPGNFVLLGDPLGANEPWVVLDEVLCLAATRRLPVTVALSIPTIEQGAINSYLNSAGDAAAKATLLEQPFWHRLWQDGRSSMAAVAMLERLRDRRAHGLQVMVLAADSNEPGNPRYAHVTAELLAHRERHPDRVIVALFGNVIMSRRPGTQWNSGLVPVGARLAAVLPESTHSFDVSYWAGAHWSCHLGPKGSLRCGTWPTKVGVAQETFALLPKPFFRAFSKLSTEGYDGLYFVGGVLTPSPPAVESLREDDGAWRKPALPTP